MSFIHPLDQERVKAPVLSVQFRACGADTPVLNGSEEGRWRDTREKAEEDLRLMRNDPFPYAETWLEARTVSAPVKLEP